VFKKSFDSTREAGRSLLQLSLVAALSNVMAATDVTYLFFQRDAGTGSADNGPLSPTIKTTRVIQTHPVSAAGTRVRMTASFPTTTTTTRTVAVLYSPTECGEKVIRRSIN